MSDHEDLIRSLLVERYRPWRPDAEPDLTAKQLARTIGPERPNRQGGETYRPRRPQPKTMEGGRTT